MKTWTLITVGGEQYVARRPTGPQFEGDIAVVELEPVLDLLERVLGERDRNAEVAEGLAERALHELRDYGAYVGAMDELSTNHKDHDLLREHGRLS